MGWTKITPDGETGNFYFTAQANFPSGIHFLIDGDLDGGTFQWRGWVPGYDADSFSVRIKTDTNDITWIAQAVIDQVGYFHWPHPLDLDGGRVEFLKTGGASTQVYAIYIWEPVIGAKYRSTV